MREARWWRPLGDKKVQCFLCRRRCIISEGKRGACGVRINKDGKLYSLIYGKVTDIVIDPIEKKPLFHFYPNSLALSIGTVGCNFFCPWCLHPEMEVLTKDGVKKIKDVNVGDVLLSYNNGSLVESKVIKKYKVNVLRENLKVYKIITESGREIIVTGEHPIKTKRGYVPAEKIKEGDFVLVSYFPFFQKERIMYRLNINKIREICHEFGFNFERILKELERRNLLVLNEEKLELIFKLIGWIIGDGWANVKNGKVYVGFSGKKEELLEICKIIEKLGFKSPKIIEKVKVSKYKEKTIKGISRWFVVNTRSFFVLLRYFGMPLSKEIPKVPKILKEFPDFIKIAFLDGLFSSDGSVLRFSKRVPIEPRYVVQGEKDLMSFLFELKEMLESLEIESTVRFIPIDNGKYYMYLLIKNSESNLMKFLKKIRYSLSPIKRRIMTLALAYLRYKNNIRNSWHNISNLYLAEIKVDVNRHVKRLWAQGLLQPKLPVSKVEEFEEWISTRKTLGDYFVWERVIKKIPIDYGFDVYDITLDKYHNFFANGILVSNCQNWVISKAIPDESGSFAIAHGYRVDLFEYSPEEILIDGNYQGVAYTYNEPTINSEFYLEIMKEAKKRDLYNVYVTNGYISEEALEDLSKYLDAANIDLKSFNKEKSLKILGIDLDELLDSIIQFHKRKIWIELTHLVVTGFNDSEEEFRKMVKWILDNLGDRVPLHITRYYPAYRYNEPPTKFEILFKFRDIAKEEGLRYVYLGNIGTGENTYCPSCGELLIERRFMRVTKWNLTKDKKCPKCGEKIDIIGKYYP